MNQLSEETRALIETNLECHAVCHSMLMTHCLERGGEHVRPQHVRLMVDCAGICVLTADWLGGKSQFHHPLCLLCAEVCEACAISCDPLDGMEDCAAICRECARMCRAHAARPVASAAI